MAMLVGGPLGLLAPGHAYAGTASVERQTTPDPYGGIPYEVDFLHYRANPGEANRLVVTFDREDALVRDSAGVTAGGGCAGTEEPGVVRCPLANDWYVYEVVLADRPLVHAWLDDLGDTARIARDGPGLEGAGAALHGGPGADDLRGGGGANRLSGDAGDDVLIGRGFSDQFLEGPVANGADTFVLGGINEVVSYAERESPVKVDVEGPTRHREGDRIVPPASGGGSLRIEGGSARDELAGGRGSDTLVGNGGGDWLRGRGGDDVLLADGLAGGREQRAGRRRTGDDLVGGAGVDQLWGNRGDNTLTGGPGPDLMVAAGGVDEMHARDGAPDRVVCGPSVDVRAILDALDFWARGRGACEVPLRPGPATAAFAGVQGGVWDGSPLLTGPRRAYAYVGCPGDAPPRCVGTASVVRRGVVLGSAPFDVARNRRDQVGVRLTARGRRLAAGYESVRVSFVVGSRDRHGVRRVTTVRGVRLGG